MANFFTYVCSVYSFLLLSPMKKAIHEGRLNDGQEVLCMKNFLIADSHLFEIGGTQWRSWLVKMGCQISTFLLFSVSIGLLQRYHLDIFRSSWCFFKYLTSFSKIRVSNSVSKMWNVVLTVGYSVSFQFIYFLPFEHLFKKPVGSTVEERLF